MPEINSKPKKELKKKQSFFSRKLNAGKYTPDASKTAGHNSK